MSFCYKRRRGGAISIILVIIVSFVQGGTDNDTFQLLGLLSKGNNRQRPDSIINYFIFYYCSVLPFPNFHFLKSE